MRDQIAEVLQLTIAVIGAVLTVLLHRIRAYLRAHVQPAVDQLQPNHGASMRDEVSSSKQTLEAVARDMSDVRTQVDAAEHEVVELVRQVKSLHRRVDQLAPVPHSLSALTARFDRHLEHHPTHRTKDTP